MPVVIFIGSASSVAAIFIFIGAAFVTCIKQKPCQKQKLFINQWFVLFQGKYPHAIGRYCYLWRGVG